MEAQQTRVPLADRNRYLNIVYFVESARSHTIRINLKHAKYAVALGLLLVAWSLGSIIWITLLKFDLDHRRKQLESSLSAVFEYQIKDEKVFDLAYPSDSTNSYYSESAQLASNNPTSEHKQEQVAERKPDPAPVKEPPKQSVPLTTPTGKAVETAASPTEGAKTDAQPQDTAPQNSSDALISISEAKLSKSGPKMTLNFAITNSKPKKAEGYIWAIATLTSNEGQNVFIIAPEHAKLDKSSGSITSYKTAYRFSIQRFKDKTFDFKVPSSLANWKLTKLTILYSDESGNSQNKVELPIDSLAVNHASNIPETSIKL
jgi:hypothetical protein